MTPNNDPFIPPQSPWYNNKHYPDGKKPPTPLSKKIPIQFPKPHVTPIEIHKLKLPKVRKPGNN